MTKKREGLADWKDEIEFLRAERAERARLRRLRADYERSRGLIAMYVLLSFMSERLFYDKIFRYLGSLTLSRYINFMGYAADFS